MQGTRFPPPKLVFKRLILDSAGEAYDFIYFEHVQFRQFLCMSPPHLGKSWKRAIAKLKLTKEDSNKLLSVLYFFAMNSTLREPEEIDARMESIIYYAIQLAGLDLDKEAAKLPDHVRFSQTRRSGSDAVDMRSDVPAILHGHDTREVAKVFEEMCVEIETDSESEDDSSEIRQHYDSPDTNQHITDLVQQIHQCQDTSSESAQNTYEKIKKLSRKKGAPKKKTTAPAAIDCRFVASVMHSIFASADLWLQSIACQGFTMGRKSSSWSESENASIRLLLETLSRKNRTLDEVVIEIMVWARDQCNKAFLKYQESATQTTCRLPLQDEKLFEMNQFLSCFAVMEILRILGEAQDICVFSSDSKRVSRETQSPAVLAKVDAIAHFYRIPHDEIFFLEPVSRMQPRVKPYPGRDSARAEKLAACSEAVASTEPMPSIAVYRPKDICRIPFLKVGENFRDGIALFCKCQKTTSAGLPCHHICQFVFGTGKVFIRNLVWLCHPVFIRGRETEEPSVFVAEPASAEVQCSSRNNSPVSNEKDQGIPPPSTALQERRCDRAQRRARSFNGFQVHSTASATTSEGVETSQEDSRIRSCRTGKVCPHASFAFA
jgi:hypothetical protein